MTQRPHHLPDYKNPPVSEVVLSIQFATLANFRSIHMGLLWQRFRKKFLKFSEHPPLNPAFETFGKRGRGQSSINVQLTQGTIVPRYWFLNADNTQLIQFQPDRFAHNWRKVGVGDKYPRYEKIKAQFSAEFRKINKFLKENEIGKIIPNQVEVTYVNHITSLTDNGSLPPFGTVFSFWSNRRYVQVLGSIEQSKFQSSFVIHSEDEEPIGRLNVSAEPAWRDDGAPFIRFVLTARGRPVKQTQKSAFDFLDLGREKIVFGFTELTTDRMHKVWGRVK